MLRSFEDIYGAGKIADLVEEARKAYKDLLMYKDFTATNGTPIKFTRRGFQEFFWSINQVLTKKRPWGGAAPHLKKNRHIIDKLLRTVAHLGAVVSKMKFDQFVDNSKPDEKPDVRGYEHYECPIVIDNMRLKLRIVFEKKLKDPTKTAYYYYHHLKEAKFTPEIYIVKFEIF